VNAESFVSVFQGISQSFSGKIIQATTDDVKEATKAAKSANMAVIVCGTTSTEGYDRANLDLNNNCDELIKSVASVQKRTVVILQVPGQVLMPWIEMVPSVVVTFFAGQEHGTAVANALFGKVNPSGRLPITFPVCESQLDFTKEQYPGVDQEEVYSEGLLVGYRYYDAKGITPLFPFGHGLSYSTFTFSKLTVTPKHQSVTIEFDIYNEDNAGGYVIPQVYVSLEKSAGDPPKNLKRFSKIWLDGHKRTLVQFELSLQDMSVWDTPSSSWKPHLKNVSVMIGESATNIHLTKTFSILHA